MTIVLLLVVSISLTFAVSGQALASGASTNTLSAGQTLGTNQTLVSTSGQYVLIMQSDGNLVTYGNGCVIWASGSDGSNSSLVMQTDGNLVVYASTGATWDSRTTGSGSNDSVVMQNDGDLVIYNGSGKAIWASGAVHADHICTGGSMSAGKYIHSASGQYELMMQADGNLVVYNNGVAQWASGTGGTGPNNSVIMQTDGNLVIYNGSGGALWASGTGGTGSGNWLSMQNDGNLVIYNSAGKALWATGTTGSGSVGSAIVSAAASMSGKPYCWAGGNTAGPTHGEGNDGNEATDCGSASTKGFDCGGLAIYSVYQAAHITITRTTIQNFGTRITSIPQLQPGDVILFGGSWNSYAHVGIYAGNGYMWNANTAPAQGVQKVLVSWETAGLNFIGAVRF